MIPAPFEYRRVDSVDEAIQALSKNGRPPGGRSLAPAVDEAPPGEALAARGHLAAAGPEVREGGRRPGRDRGAHAAPRRGEQRGPAGAVSHRVAAAGEIGDPQVRHVGTIGGSVAHADPASDMPTVLVRSRAEMQVRGPGGVRERPDRATSSRACSNPTWPPTRSDRDPRPKTALEFAGRRTGRWWVSRRSRRTARALGRPDEHGRPTSACGWRRGGAGGGRRSGGGVGASRGSRSRRPTPSRAPSTAGSS